MEIAGTGAPSASASVVLVAPAARPFTMAMKRASASAPLRVRLLSSAQARHAPTTAKAGAAAPKPASPGHESTTAPATISPIPTAARRSSARAAPRQPVPRRAKAPFAGPRKHHGTGDDQSHPERDAPVEVLPEDEPGEERREHRLGIEQQRRAGRGHARQPPHEEHRSKHAAAQDRAREPAPLASSKARAFAATQHKQKCEPDAGAEVKEAREKPRIDFAEQQLGERRACAEEQRRPKGCCDARV